jgi:hypothetical protein
MGSLDVIVHFHDCDKLGPGSLRHGRTFIAADLTAAVEVEQHRVALVATHPEFNGPPPAVRACRICAGRVGVS